MDHPARPVRVHHPGDRAAKLVQRLLLPAARLRGARPGPRRAVRKVAEEIHSVDGASSAARCSLSASPERRCRLPARRPSLRPTPAAAAEARRRRRRPSIARHGVRRVRGRPMASSARGRRRADARSRPTGCASRPRQEQPGEARRRARRVAGLRTGDHRHQGRRTQVRPSRIALQYDDAKLYVGADVSDAQFDARRGKDHVVARARVPTPGGRRTRRTTSAFSPASRGTREGTRARAGRGGDVPGAEDRRGPRAAAGYSFEATIPWSAMPEARTTRVGLHGLAALRRRRRHESSATVATGDGTQHAARHAAVRASRSSPLIEQAPATRRSHPARPRRSSSWPTSRATGEGARRRLGRTAHHLRRRVPAAAPSSSSAISGPSS